MLIKVKPIENGYNEITNMKTIATSMLMDIGVQKIPAGEICQFLDEEKETAFLLMDGQITFVFEDQSIKAERHSLFDENPVALHVSKGTAVKIEAQVDSEVLVQKTDNNETFPSKFYSQDQCRTDIFGENVWNDTARRAVRTVFDYGNAPYSNMVLGEVINYPGKWSSYIPHGHDQPEVYYYRFDRPQGFGVGFIGDEAFKTFHNSALCIDGGPTHPQATAPGYAMWYCWMIRHLKENPWTSRIDDESHKWLLEKDVKIWPEK